MAHEEQVSSVQEGSTWTRISKIRICTQTSMSSLGSWCSKYLVLHPLPPSPLPTAGPSYLPSLTQAAGASRLVSSLLLLPYICPLLHKATRKMGRRIKSFSDLKAFRGFQRPTSSCSSSHELSHLGTFTNPAPSARRNLPYVIIL